MMGFRFLHLGEGLLFGLSWLGESVSSVLSCGTVVKIPSIVRCYQSCRGKKFNLIVTNCYFVLS